MTQSHQNFPRRAFLKASVAGAGAVGLSFLADESEAVAKPAKPELAPQLFDLTEKPPHLDRKSVV